MGFWLFQVLEIIYVNGVEFLILRTPPTARVRYLSFMGHCLRSWLMIPTDIPCRYVSTTSKVMSVNILGLPFQGCRGHPWLPPGSPSHNCGPRNRLETAFRNVMEKYDIFIYFIYVKSTCDPK